MQHVVAFEHDPLLSTRFLDENVGLVDEVKVQRDGNVNVESASQPVAAKGFGVAPVGANATTGAAFGRRQTFASFALPCLSHS